MLKQVRHRLRFVSAFVRDPIATGSIVPSSRFLAGRLLRQVNWNRARVIVELGPGTGCVTREILGRMHPSATLVAIELNPSLAQELRKTGNDSRLKVRTGSALALEVVLEEAGLQRADHIISSLPFANMSRELRVAIVERVRECLVPGGTFTLFQYRKLLVPVLQELFPSVRSEYEWRNLPPARVFHCSAPKTTQPVRVVAPIARNESEGRTTRNALRRRG